MKAPLANRILAEIIGTFGFFFAGFSGLAANILHKGSIDGQGMAVGFGLGLAMMIFAFGHISGGHYNPAVTLGLACGGRLGLRRRARVGPRRDGGLDARSASHRAAARRAARGARGGRRSLSERRSRARALRWEALLHPASTNVMLANQSVDMQKQSDSSGSDGCLLEERGLSV